MAVLPKSLQEKMIKDMLKAKGVDPDTVDVSHEIDQTLTYPENEANIKAKFVQQKEEQMYSGSEEGALREDFESLKKKAVSREDVERLVAKSMKAREAEVAAKQQQLQNLKQEVAKVPDDQLHPEVTQAKKASAIKMINQKIRGLQGAAYRKFVQPRQEKKAAEEKSKLERQLASVNAQLAEKKDIDVAIKQGKLTGTRQAARLFYKKQTEQQLLYQQLQPERSEGIRSKLVALITGYKTTTNPYVRRQLALEIAKKKNELFVQQEVEKKVFGLRLAQAQREAARQQLLKQYKEQLQNGTVPPAQYYPRQGFNPLGPPRYVVNFNPMGPHPMARPMMVQPMPVMRRQRPQQGRRVPGQVPPHQHQPNLITGVCRICGRKAVRFL